MEVKLKIKISLKKKENRPILVGVLTFPQSQGRKVYFDFGNIQMTEVVFLCRSLTDRQRALLMSYAEDETDVEGTVNGVTVTTTGNVVHSRSLRAIKTKPSLCPPSHTYLSPYPRCSVCSESYYQFVRF